MSDRYKQQTNLMMQAVIEDVADKFTARGVITHEDIFQNDNEMITKLFMGHIGTCYGAKQFDNEELRVEIGGYFGTHIPTQDYNNIILNYNRKRDVNDSFLRYLSKSPSDFISNPHYNTPRENFLEAIAQAQILFKLPRRYLSVLVHYFGPHNECKPYSPKTLDRILKPFIANEILRKKNL